MLPKRTLGKTDMEVSILGLGTVKLGRNEGVKYPQSFKIPDDKEAATLIGLAKDSGINLIDTAPAYGNSEQRLGKLLKEQRQDWLVIVCLSMANHTMTSPRSTPAEALSAACAD